MTHFPQGFCILCCFFQGIIVSLPFYHGRKTSIRGTDPPVIPIADEISPDEGFQFIRAHLLCIVAVIEQFRFHSGPHALAAGVIMASATCTVHTLSYAILPDYVPVKLAGVLASPITVDNCPMQDMSSPRFPVSAHIMELSYSYPSPAQPHWNRSSQKQRKHTAFHRWL